MNLIQPLFSILPHSSNSLWGPRFWALELHIKRSPASSSVTHEVAVLNPSCIKVNSPWGWTKSWIKCHSGLKKDAGTKRCLGTLEKYYTMIRFGGTEVQLRIQSGKLYLCDSPKRLLLIDYFKTFYFVFLAQIAKCSLVSQDRLQTACAR